MCVCVVCVWCVCGVCVCGVCVCVCGVCMCVLQKPDRLKNSELLFADDAAAVGTSRRSMEAAATALEELITAWGLSLSIPKTKLLVAGTPHSEDLQPLQLAGGSAECVTDFQYLGSVVEAKGGVGKDVCERIAKLHVHLVC